MVFPVMMLVMFAHFLGGGMAVEGGASGDDTDYLVPGMLALTMAFGLESTMVALTQDINRGILDRFRSMPIAPSSVLVGRSLLDMLESTAGLLVMIGAGLTIGWRWHGTPAEALAAVGLLLLLRFAMLWVGIYLGLVAGGPRWCRPCRSSSGRSASSPTPSPHRTPCPAGSAPSPWGHLPGRHAWGRNPMSATAGAVRDLFGNPGWSGDSWAATHPVPLAVAWPLLLLALCAPLAMRRFSRLND
ncbi:ABC transporter permease [Streptomyces mayteni]